MLYNFDKVVKSLDGNQIQAITLLKEVIGTETGKDNIVKMMYWYNQICDGKKEFEIDDVDRDFLVSVIKFREGLFLWAKSELLKILEP